MKKYKFLITILFLLFFMRYELRATSYELFAQDANKLVSLSKQIIEAKSEQEMYLALDELSDLYFRENKYNEFVEFLSSLVKQKKNLGPTANYYIALTRYHQLRYLEDTQNWNEYFSNADTYRNQLEESAKKAITSTTSSDPLNLYSRLILWRFHKEQQDSFAEAASADLMNSVLEYTKNTTATLPIKDVADQFLSYGEKANANSLYKIYVEKVVSSKIEDAGLYSIASGFYKEGNLDLAEALFDAYIERIIKSIPKEKSIPVLIGLAKTFSYSATTGARLPDGQESALGREDGAAGDPAYAEKIFLKIEEIGGKNIFDEELLYSRAFNLEKIKEYLKARDIYIDLLKRYPKSSYADKANFKIGVIYTYVARDPKNGKTYFEKLLQEKPTPEGISSFYQLGLLSQWEQDYSEAKRYYQKLLEQAEDKFTPLETKGREVRESVFLTGLSETVAETKERLEEIREAKPIEYSLKTFLDVSLKEQSATLGMGQLDLKSHPYLAKQNQEVRVSTTAYTTESGCMEVQLQYLWSGNLGSAKPLVNETAFNTSYADAGTKVINLVVVSPTGIVDRIFDLLDVD